MTSSVKKSVSGSSKNLQSRNYTSRRRRTLVPTHIRRSSDGSMTVVIRHSLSPRGQAVKTRLVDERKSILEQQDEIEERFNSLLKMLKL